MNVPPRQPVIRSGGGASSVAGEVERCGTVPRGSTPSAPGSCAGGEHDGRGPVAGEPVVSRGEAPEVLEAAEAGREAPALARAAFVMADLAFAATLSEISHGYELSASLPS